MGDRHGNIRTVARLNDAIRSTISGIDEIASPGLSVVWVSKSVDREAEHSSSVVGHWVADDENVCFIIEGASEVRTKAHH